MYERELAAMQKAALDAEKIIRRVYATAFAVEIKSDDSPVTAADKESDKLISEELHAAFPSYAFLTEESVDNPVRLTNDFVFIVDPLDGTREFVARNGEFTTNIALCYQHKIVAGVINVPMKDVMYYAVLGQGAYRLDKGKAPLRIHVSDRTKELIAVRSRSYFNPQEKALLDKHQAEIKEIRALGAALKFCAIAEGQADISYRESPGTKEWDIAAGTIILQEAGGFLLKHDLTEYSFNRIDVYNRQGYVLVNRKENVLL
jgi:3'(2'), 5'-bisphosphate nucleotidase